MSDIDFDHPAIYQSLMKTVQELDKITQRDKKTIQKITFSKEIKNIDKTELDEYIPQQSEKVLNYQQQNLSLNVDQRNNIAQILKQEGNNYFQEGNYIEALQKYNNALNLKPNNSHNNLYYLLLNRAITYIKLSKFEEAIIDCTKVLQLIKNSGNEIIKQFTKDKLIDQNNNKDFHLKAYLRRSLAKYNLFAYNDALDDIESVLQFSPSNQEALKLKNEILILQKQYNQRIVDEFILGKQVLFNVFKAIQINTQQVIEYFHQKNGIDSLIKIIQLDDEIHDEQNLYASLPALVLFLYLNQEQVYREHFFFQCQGIDIILNKIDKLLNLRSDIASSAVFDTVEDYLQCLDFMKEDKIRIHIQSNKLLKHILFPELTNKILSLYLKEYDLVASYLKFLTNCIYGSDSPIRIMFSNYLKDFISQITIIYQTLVINIDSQILFIEAQHFLGNLVVEESFRRKFLDLDFILEFYVQLFSILKKIKGDNQYKELKNAIFNFLINLTYQINSFESDFITNIIKIIPILIEYLQCETTYCQSILTILSKTYYEDDFFIINQYIEQFNNESIRCIVQWLSKRSQKITKQFAKQAELQKLCNLLQKLLNTQNNMIFCNVCSAIVLILDQVSMLQLKFNPYEWFNKQIELLLIKFKTDNYNIRVASHQVIARLVKDEQNLKIVKDLGGFEIMQNVINTN